MSTTDDRLRSIVGYEAVISDNDHISGHFRVPLTDESELRVVLPETADEVQKIVKLAIDEKIPVFTTYDTYFPASVASFKTGILLDFKHMNKIERIDPKNLMVHVQRGVTFEQLITELKRYDMDLALPAVATSKSPAEQYVSRCITTRAARYHEIAASNMKVVLPDGNIHLSGSHALSEDAADHKADGAANLSQWYWGADDIYGIVTRASIWAFPVFEKRKILAFGFDRLEDASGLIRNLPRREVCTMAIALNRTAFKEKAGVEDDNLNPWIAVIGIEGMNKLVDLREKIALGVAEEKGANNLTHLLDDKTDMFEVPWYSIESSHLGFYSLFNRISEFDSIIEKSGLSPEDMGILAVSISNGSGVWLEYEFPKETESSKIDELGISLASAGAFFDRPHGKLAESIYSKMDGSYIRHIKRIKTMLDPHNILNPGIPVTL